MNNYDEKLKQLKEMIGEKIDYSRDMSDEEMQEMIGEQLLSRECMGKFNLAERKLLGKDLFFSLRKLDILQEVIENPEITEIMINGTDSIFIEQNGKISEWEKHFDSKEKLNDVIQQIVAKCNRTVNEASPIVDARLENGSRVNVVLNPVALNGPIITIRRFPEHPITMEKLIDIGSLTSEAASFLEHIVRAGYNIIVSGGTGSGKTTFLNALSEYIPKDERIITIEDSAELQIQGIKNLIRMETRNANVEGCNPITIRNLIKTSLRMRPDRIIVGEVRGEEAIDMMQCLNCGHDGSMSTGHSNSAKDMLTRLETMILMGMEIPLSAIRRQMASGIDIIIHLGRLRDKTRKVLEIVEVDEYKDGEIEVHSLYQFEESNTKKKEKVEGSLQKKGELKHIEKLQAAGLDLQKM